MTTALCHARRQDLILESDRDRYLLFEGSPKSADAPCRITLTASHIERNAKNNNSDAFSLYNPQNLPKASQIGAGRDNCFGKCDSPAVVRYRNAHLLRPVVNPEIAHIHLLYHCKDFCAIIGKHKRMLKVRGWRTIGSPKCPSVLIKPNVARPEGRHGLNRNNHTFFQERAGPRLSVIRNNGIFVDIVSNAVPRKPANNAKTLSRKKRFDRSAYVSDPISGLYLFDANKKRFFGFFHEMRQNRRDRAYSDCTSGISHQGLSGVLQKFFRLVFRPRHSYIDSYNITITKNNIISRDRMHHFV